MSLHSKSVINIIVTFLLHMTITSAVALSSKQVRLFHPSFPLKFKSVLSENELSKLIEVKERLRSSSISSSKEKFKRLPWKTMPEIGISASLDKDVYSAKEIEDAFESDKHNGYFVWANKLKNPVPGCFLLNHWTQQVVKLTDHTLERGGQGYEIILGQTPVSAERIYWPPFTLEMEVAKNLWQPVEVSPNIANGEIFKYFPSQMSTAPWEFIFLLLLSPDEDTDIYQTLFDTGLSPRQGFLAYLRLLDLMTQRTSVWEDTPSYRKVFETDILM